MSIHSSRRVTAMEINRRWPFMREDDEDDQAVEPYDEYEDARIRRDDWEGC